MPLPNHRLIPAGWSAHHRPTAEGRFTATGTVTIPASAADATFDEELGYTTPGAATTVYTGPMSVQRLPVGSNVSTVQVGGREVIIRPYRVSLPIDGPTRAVPVGAIVTITDEGPGGDPDLVGRPLHVREVPLNTLAWQRDLLCEDPAPTTR